MSKALLASLKLYLDNQLKEVMLQSTKRRVLISRPKYTFAYLTCLTEFLRSLVISANL